MSRSLTESRLFGETAAKPRSFASASRSIGNAVPASAAAPRGIDGGPRAAVGEPVAIALHHEHVGQKVVAQHDRLRALQVRVARQRRFERLGGARDQRLLHAPQSRANARDDLAKVQAFVDRDLIVA